MNKTILVTALLAVAAGCGPSEEKKYGSKRGAWEAAEKLVCKKVHPASPEFLHMTDGMVDLMVKDCGEGLYKIDGDFRLPGVTARVEKFTCELQYDTASGEYMVVSQDFYRLSGWGED